MVQQGARGANRVAAWLLRIATGVTLFGVVAVGPACGSSISNDTDDGGSDGTADGGGDGGGDGAGIVACGNRQLDPGEECDDGNRLNGDGCDWRCQEGDGEAPPVRPPDPEAGDAELALTPTTIDLGVPDPRAAAAGESFRVPLVWAHGAYSTVWLGLADSGTTLAAVQGSFLQFDKSAARSGIPWIYDLVPTACLPMSFRPRVDLDRSPTGFGMLWIGRNSCPAGEGPGVSFAVLDSRGKLLGAPVVLSTWAVGAERLGLARNGTGFGAVADGLESGEPGSNLGLLAIDEAGALLLPARVVLSAGREGVGASSLASSDGLHVFTWTAYASGDYRNTAYYAVATSDGEVLGSAGLGPVSAGTPDIVWSGEEFGIAWLGAAVTTEEPTVMFARLTARGAMVEAPRIVVELSLERPRELAITYGSGAYAIGGFTPYRVVVHRVDRNGTLLETVGSPSRGRSSFWPAFVGAAADDDGYGFLGAEALVDSEGHTRPGGPVFARLRVVR